jgi:putative endopeptidase
MRITMVLALAALMAAGAPAQTSARLGVDVADMNRSIDACTDFFEYANGTWRANNPIPDFMDRWSRRWASGELSKDQLRAILDEVSAKPEQPKGSTLQLIGDHYASCMDQASIDRLGLDPVKPWLAQVGAIHDRAGIQQEIIRLHQVGIEVPFGFGSQQDNHNPTQVIAGIQASGLGLPDRDYYTKSEDRFKQARDKYLSHVANMFKLAGYNEDAARQSATAVLAFETRLAEASLDNVALRDPHATDHKMTFDALQQLSPTFDWAAYYKGAGLSPADLNVGEPKFLQEVDRQLKAASVQDWKTYLTWQLLHSAADSLSQPFVEENFNFYGKTLAGVSVLKPRWKRCVESTDRELGEALGKEYVARYFPPEAKARMQEMVKNILLAMGDTIRGLEWMSPETKLKAQQKLATFNPKVGYPDKWKDYSKLDIRRNAYWDNVIAGRKFAVADDLSQIGKPVDRDRWGMTPPTSNAYYNPLLNEIVFPAGILQPPAFNMKAVDAVNYGAIGVVIGHEISHGFDDEGAQFDAQGRLNNWWTAADLEKFQARTKCVADQFDGYFIEPGIHHNGKLVLGESIGDLAGAKIAYLAFKKSLEGKPPAPTIDGFTPDQQFFIAWGQFRGDATRPETQRLMIQGDPHPVAKFRVIGPLSNLPEFQAAFACKAGSAMVRPPAQRCEVW